MVKLVLTGAALGVTAYSGVLGARLRKENGTPVEGGTDPSSQTPSDVADVQRQLDLCQWLIPALTGAAVVSTSIQGEQQRPTQQLSGVLATTIRRINPRRVNTRSQSRVVAARSESWGFRPSRAGLSRRR
ncbi:MAG TPA: hypothetical protein VFX16_35545 [Pseudonocardiaceae bacterium]|nr:hypothetical protein [Pseudonocardiaceae bacterium]